MSIRSVQEVISSLQTLCPFNSGFNVGDGVTFTNEFGVSFKGLTVIGFSAPSYEGGGWIHLNTDSYWFPHKPDELTKEKTDGK